MDAGLEKEGVEQCSQRDWTGLQLVNFILLWGESKVRLIRLKRKRKESKNESGVGDEQVEDWIEMK